MSSYNINRALKFHKRIEKDKIDRSAQEIKIRGAKKLGFCRRRFMNQKEELVPIHEDVPSRAKEALAKATFPEKVRGFHRGEVCRIPPVPYSLWRRRQVMSLLVPRSQPIRGAGGSIMYGKAVDEPSEMILVGMHLYGLGVGGDGVSGKLGHAGSPADGLPLPEHHRRLSESPSSSFRSVCQQRRFIREEAREQRGH